MQVEQQVGSEESSIYLSQDSIQVFLRLPADGVYLANALQTLREICEQVEMPEERARRVQLAVEEALLNSFEHAYRDRSDGFVETQFIIESGEFIVVIEDFGTGFNSTEYDAPSEPEQILADRGRGHLLMRAMADNMVLDSAPGRGTRTTLRFATPSTQVS